MSKTPIVSVIVPIYNVEKHLKKCLNSIAAQTYTDFECIMVNDGSPDNSEEICCEFCKRDSRFILINKENGGLSSARNAGIDKATGKYIAFVDSDDYVEDTYLETLLSCIENVSLSVISYIMEKESSPNTLYKRRYDTNCITGDDCACLLARGKAPGYVCNMLYIADLIKQNSLKFDEAIKYCEDVLFNIRYFSLIKQDKVVWSKKVCYHYVQRPDSILNGNFDSKRLSLFDLFSKMKMKGLFTRYPGKIQMI